MHAIEIAMLAQREGATGCEFLSLCQVSLARLWGSRYDSDLGILQREGLGAGG